jgi:hypothetical protein
MKNKFLLVIIIVSAITLAGCGQVAKNKPLTSGAFFSAIKNPQKMIHGTLSIYKPGDWQEVKLGKFLYYLPIDKTATDTLAEKIEVAVFTVPTSSAVTLAELMKNDFLQNQNGFIGYKFVSSSEFVKLGPLSAREETYQAKISSSTINITQIDARSGGLLYKIQHYCLQNQCLADGIFTEMVRSFEPSQLITNKK